MPAGEMGKEFWFWGKKQTDSKKPDWERTFGVK